MRLKDVQLGATYAVKISGRVVPVTLLAVDPWGGWAGRNERTGRTIRVRSAQKLRARLVRNEAGRWALASPRPSPSTDSDHHRPEELAKDS